MAASKAVKVKRTINQYCSVCKKDFDMEVVDGDASNEVLWLKCPGCEGYLPYMTDEEEDGVQFDSGAAGENAAELAPEDIDKDQAKEYEESSEYEVGDIIYHRSWNDYGKVIVKEELPGHRKTIVVSFINQGNIRLLEGVT